MLGVVKAAVSTVAADTAMTYPLGFRLALTSTGLVAIVARSTTTVAGRSLHLKATS